MRAKMSRSTARQEYHSVTQFSQSPFMLFKHHLSARVQSMIFVIIRRLGRLLARLIFHATAASCSVAIDDV